MIVTYEDKNGKLYVVEVPDDFPEERYRDGLVLGPPELDDLNVPAYRRKKIHNALAEAGIYNAYQLLGRRRDVRTILEELNLPVTLERDITSIFHKQISGER